MADFLAELPLFCLLLTVVAYQIGLWCRKKTGSTLCNPLLISIILVIGVLLLTGISPEKFQEKTVGFSWLLTPATVCLALPLYQQLKLLKKNLPAILTGVIAGTLTGLISVFVMCKLMGLDRQLTVSLLPKSITTAMGIVLSEQNGGVPAITSVVIILTGILGSLCGSAVSKLLNLRDPVSQGVAFGTATHVIGTTRATELDPVAGAVSSLSLTVSGILTAILFPLFCAFS